MYRTSGSIYPDVFLILYLKIVLIDERQGVVII